MAWPVINRGMKVSAWELQNVGVRLSRNGTCKLCSNIILIIIPISQMNLHVRLHVLFFSGRFSVFLALLLFAAKSLTYSSCICNSFYLYATLSSIVTQ